MGSEMCIRDRVRAARDGLLEDGGVGGDAGDAAGDEGLQLAGVDLSLIHI